MAAGIRGGISSDAVGVVAPSGHAPYHFTEQQLGEVEHASWNGQQLARVRANGVSSPGRGAFAERQRGLAMARMQITHFKCLSCAASIRNGEDKCGACGYERPAASALVSSVREQERGAARDNTARGRAMNKTTGNTEQLGVQVAPSSDVPEVWKEQREAKKTGAKGEGRKAKG